MKQRILMIAFLLAFAGVASAADRSPAGAKAVVTAVREAARLGGAVNKGAALGEVVGKAISNARDNSDIAAAKRANAEREAYDRIRNRPAEAKAMVDAAKYGGIGPSPTPSAAAK
jgi:hypothetical protein